MSAGLNVTDQLNSWCNPHGHIVVEGLVGQICFPTDIDSLDQQDRHELSRLRPEFSALLLGHRVHFWCVGRADHRAGIAHNRELGLRRAVAVKRHLDTMFRGARFYSAAEVSTRGELDAAFPLPTQKQLALDRRVDVFVNILRRLPRSVRLNMIQIVGRIPPAIDITELMNPARHPNEWLPASRTDEPVEGTRADRVTLVARLAQYANQVTVEANIRIGLEEVRPVVAFKLMDARGGILVVACIDVTTQGEVSVGRVAYVADDDRIFATPEEAVRHWQRQARLDAPTARPPFGRVEYRLFWATRR